MSELRFPELFPIAIGNEEESMLLTGRDIQNLDDPIAFVSNAADFIPKGIKKVGAERMFLQNGGLVYDGGVGDTDPGDNINLERATPECSTPREVAVYVQAQEKLYVEMLKNFVEHKFTTGNPEMARAQRRVVDSYDNGRACHDSFEARWPSWMESFDHNVVAKHVLSTYLATRSLMTGAGYVTPGGIHFAQKVQHLTILNKYGFVNSAYRNASEHDSTGARLEIRCNDINISPWAIQERVGSMALLFTLLQTPIVHGLTNYLPYGMPDFELVRNFQRFNEVKFDEDGQIVATRDNYRSLDFQDRVFELIDEELPGFVDVTDDYTEVIYEARQYLEDFRRVLDGEAELALLADRSDMAAKFSRIFELNEKAKEFGVFRKIGDIASMASDLKYDNITVKADSNGHAKVTYGHGYKLRSKGAFRMSPSDSEVEYAVLNPPVTTRAKIRGNLIRRGKIDRCEWMWVKYNGEQDKMKIPEVLLEPSTEDGSTQKR